MPKYHIVQINIARMLAPIDDPIMEAFVAQLAPINALATGAPGFVWRLRTEEGDTTSLKVYDDDLIIVNMSGGRMSSPCVSMPIEVHILE